MGRTRQTNTWMSGMNMDLDYALLKESQYNYAENVRVMANGDNTIGTLQNIEGFIKTNPTHTLHNETIIHVNTIRDLAIVFTKVNGTTDSFNVYRIDFSDSDINPEVTKIVDAKKLGISPSTGGVYAISSICRWESNNNVKIYWADGQNQIKVLNVDSAHDNFNSNVTEDSVTILPKSVLPPLEFKGFGSGSLTAGKVQYCYQLFNTRSSETSISVLSPMIHLAKADSRTNSEDIIGSEKNENTGKSVIVETELLTGDFERAKVISIHYSSNTSLPTIHIVGDIAVNGTTLRFEDKGSGALSELTLDEFNALVSYPFIPEVIEAKDNILFAANITEVTWDVTGYDTRAYRCNASGEVKLNSTSGQGDLTFNINNLTATTVPEDHDCICPYNQDSSDTHRYKLDSDGSLVYGGKGLNIEYELVTSDLIEDSSVVSTVGYSSNDFSLNSEAFTCDSLPVNRINSNGQKENLDSISLTSKSRVINYSDAEIDAKLRSLQRDEVYRFAIVFYNDANLPSSAHWIADIRTPNMSDNGYQIFENSETVSITGITNRKMTLITHPLGVRFTVKNIPSYVTGFEIVRCERTVADRSILMQGIISDVVNYDSTSSMLLCPPYLSYAQNHGYYANQDGDSTFFGISDNYRNNNYFMFISPELCVNRENAETTLEKGTHIETVSTLMSKILDSSYTRVLAGAKKIKPDGKTLVTPSVSTEGCVDSGEAIILNSTEDEYSATVAKYYQTMVSTVQSASINSIKLANLTDTFDTANNNWQTKGTGIGEKVFYNWVEIGYTGSGKERRKVGPHGICAVFNSDNMPDNISRPYAPVADAGIFANSVILCNLKQNVNPYGGQTYAARQNSTYISTGAYSSTSGSEAVVNAFGGDTYIGVLDYANAMLGFPPSDYTSWSTNRVYNGAYIPCESSINLSLRGDSIQTSKTYDAGSGYANHFVQNDITVIGNIYTQTEPLYKYFDAYSAQNTAKTFVSKSIYNIDNMTNDARVMHSEMKTNNEVTDSWTKFKVANYLDLDNRFGSINQMKLFKNNLLFWQTDAFGTLAVNERSLITDNNPGALTLGTGDTLTRYDYMTTKNGLKANHLRAVTQSDSTVYWYDYDRNEICGFNGNLETVSKLKGVQSYLTANREQFNIDPSTAYDKKYNEVLFTLEGKSLVFNEQLGVFTSFYTIAPDRYIEFTDKIFTFKDLQLYKYNSGDDQDLYTGKDKVSYIRFTVNKDYPQTKTFDNVEYGGNFTYGTNFYSIIFDTKRQTSYETTDEQIDYREDTYKFAIPRNNIELNEAEELVNKSYKDRMKGKYLVCHYKYDCNGGNTFDVPYISTAYRYSMI